MFKKITTILLCLASSVILLAGFGAQAAYFPDYDKDNITFTEEGRDNVYIAGETVKVNSNVNKDAVLAGSNVKVKGNVERSLIAAGQNIEVNNQQIGSNVFLAGQNIDIDTTIENGSLRAAGQNVTISGVYSDDVIIASGSLDISNATIKGDLIAASENVSFGDNVTVEGDFYGDDSIDDLEDVVQGDIKEIEESDADFEWESDSNADRVFGWILSLGGLFTTIILTLIAMYVLKRGNKLTQYWERSPKRVAINWVIGLLALILPPLVIILSFFLQIYTFIIPLSIIVYSLFAISLAFTGLYLSQLIFAQKNGTVMWYHVIGTIIVLHVLSWIPFVNWAVNILNIILLPATFGWILWAIYRSFTGAIMQKSDDTTKEVM